MHCTAVLFLLQFFAFATARHSYLLHRRQPTPVALPKNTTNPWGDDPIELQKRDGTKYVFMHHYVFIDIICVDQGGLSFDSLDTYPYTQSDWEDDLRQIQAKGVDAIALNIGSADWQRSQVASAYAAAAAIRASVKLFISFDFTEMPCSVSDVASRANQWSNHAYQFRVNGKTMISSYSGDCFGNDGWAAIKSQTNGYLMPFIWGLEGKFNQWPSLDSWYCWGCAWPNGNQYKTFDDDNYYINQLGSRFATTVSGWIYTHYSYKNFLQKSDNWLLNTRWEQLVGMRDKLTFVEMVTWNDYGESDYFGPIKGAQPDGTTWATGFPHTAWFDMSQYYITAFKTGSYPAITKDVVYFWARPHPAGITASGDPIGKPQGWDWLEDSLWAVVFATSSASVTLQSGNIQNTFNVGAGVSKLKIQLAPGQITVKMSKNGQVIINKTPNDFTYKTNTVRYNYNAYVDSASAMDTPIISSSTTSPTVPTPSSTSYTYLGCYLDPNNARVLNNGMTSSTSQTVASCMASCAARGFAYGGTEYSTECWCGSAIAQGASRVSESDCSMPCSGKSSDVCGGGNRISLYQVGSGSSGSSSTATSSSATPSSTPSGWSYVGCVAEGTTGSRRALTDKSFTGRSDMTAGVCQSLCSGYKYAATEYGNECYCGNTLTNNGATGNPIDPSSCNSNCAGDSSQKCGGGWIMSLYTNGGSASTSWTSAGCYIDGGSRMLRGLSTSNSAMTTEMCISTCTGAGYSIAATEYGSECYCGNQIFKEGGAGVPTSSGDCSMSCSGNSGQKCGSSWRGNVS
ncbi:hypothetical protein HGRIS_012737 [Hohenbuehelia grisea]|uniref:WSC domain-containing protein n=1 Tax=Hohenbuehelia grisea TaxID=104357 RepID=A0ABR3ITD6_9AGAR